MTIQKQLTKKEAQAELYVESAPQILLVTFQSVKAEWETGEKVDEADHRYGRSLHRTD